MESRMRETRTYGLTRGRTYPTRGVPLYSTRYDTVGVADPCEGERFPDQFMFQVTEENIADVRSQIVTLGNLRGQPQFDLVVKF